MSMISKIYNSDYILHKSGSRFGKTKTEINSKEAKIVNKKRMKSNPFNRVVYTKRSMTPTQYQFIKDMNKLNLTDWEKQFCKSLLQKNKILSVKQLNVLNSLSFKYKLKA